jgi:hypothetical protein
MQNKNINTPRNYFCPCELFKLEIIHMLPSKQNSYNITASLMKTTQCVESKMKIKIEAKGDI